MDRECVLTSIENGCKFTLFMRGVSVAVVELESSGAFYRVKKIGSHLQSKGSFWDRPEVILLLSHVTRWANEGRRVIVGDEVLHTKHIDKIESRLVGLGFQLVKDHFVYPPSMEK